MDTRRGHRASGLWLAGSLLAAFVLVAGTAFAAHPPIQLKTYEELGAMDVGPNMPLPYSPKQTCSTSGCHDGTTVVNGKVLLSYGDIEAHAFHSQLGKDEWKDTADGQFDLTASKPWNQTGAMFGKW
ncbi:cytochrome C [Dissulfurirhabdus thermomarina]|uniref:Cytochrome C n=1 Tax=Dissulfurirhabdus thermomarina TaxID=1765737 RepID=A0A6N9TNV0_DISTH|nr:cytochrome C [Dissulfurirhabdus thermomarina]NDY41424.1 cytochrome C [Dissulfurirhabdus thermomarina]NMX24412.1 cytochrome C [Dissulfurirhabdus thermomarina]